MMNHLLFLPRNRVYSSMRTEEGGYPPICRPNKLILNCRQRERKRSSEVATGELIPPISNSGSGDFSAKSRRIGASSAGGPKKIRQEPKERKRGRK